MDPEFYYRRPGLQNNNQPQQTSNSAVGGVVSTGMASNNNANQYLTPEQQQQMTNLSWKCEVCGYYVLAMDQSGKGLPLEPGPSGEIIPLKCPRCLQEHSHWTPISPFDAFGDHANLPSALSNRVTHGASIFEHAHAQRLTNTNVQMLNNANGKNSNNTVTNSQQNTPQVHGTISPEQLMTSSVQSNSLQYHAPLVRESQHKFQDSTSNHSSNNNNANNATTGGGGGAGPSPSSVMTINLGNSVQQAQLELVNGVPMTQTPGQGSISGGGRQQLQQQQRQGMMINNNEFNNNTGGRVSTLSPGTNFEYEYLADHDALKDPDVVEALQRLRRRRGAANNTSNSHHHNSKNSKFSQKYLGGGSQSYYENNTQKESLLTDEQISRLPESSLQRAAAHRVTAPRALECYVCGVCGRRLLRIDHKGELIPIESDAHGRLAEIECFGCKQTHSRWLRVMLNNTSSEPMQQKEGSGYSSQLGDGSASNMNLMMMGSSSSPNGNNTIMRHRQSTSHNPAMTMTNYASPQSQMLGK